MFGKRRGSTCMCHSVASQRPPCGMEIAIHSLFWKKHKDDARAAGETRKRPRLSRRPLLGPLLGVEVV